MFRNGTCAGVSHFGKAKKTVGLAAKVERDFIQVTPSPVFIGLEGAHDGVLSGMEVFGGVFIFGRVTAANVTALKAEAEVYPAVALLETFFAAFGCARCDASDVAKRGVEMYAFRHADIVPYLLLVKASTPILLRTNSTADLRKSAASFPVSACSLAQKAYFSMGCSSVNGP